MNDTTQSDPVDDVDSTISLARAAGFTGDLPPELHRFEALVTAYIFDQIVADLKCRAEIVGRAPDGAPNKDAAMLFSIMCNASKKTLLRAAEYYRSLSSRYTDAVRTRMADAPAPAAQGQVYSELPDSVRVPLHSLWADAGYLVGRAKQGEEDYVVHRIKALCDEVERAVLAELRSDTKG